MHTVELLERGLELARECGFVVRQDELVDVASGVCHFKGRRYLFLDLALPPADQLAVVLSALRSDTTAATRTDCSELAQLLAARKAA